MTTNEGRGIRGVTILLTDAEGAVRTATTSSFGYYRFGEVAAGATYVFTARSKHYGFRQASRILSISDEIGEVNFIAAPPRFISPN